MFQMPISHLSVIVKHRHDRHNHHRNQRPHAPLSTVQVGIAIFEIV